MEHLQKIEDMCDRVISSNTIGRFFVDNLEREISNEHCDDPPQSLDELVRRLQDDNTHNHQQQHDDNDEDSRAVNEILDILEDNEKQVLDDVLDIIDRERQQQQSISSEIERYQDGEIVQHEQQSFDEIVKVLQEDPILTMLQDNEDNRLVDQDWLINDVLSVYANDNNAATANDFVNEETTLLNDGDVCQMLSQYFVDINHIDVFLNQPDDNGIDDILPTQQGGAYDNHEPGAYTIHICLYCILMYFNEKKHFLKIYLMCEINFFFFVRCL